jgi:hypothetical protein
LRELFSSRAGFRRLCFRQKSNGPMCFVEFEDVQFATRALNDLYGNDLKGLVKGGIRLSYSKNPLGVRTPTSATSNSSLQQQLLQNGNNNNNMTSNNGSYPSTLAPEFQPRQPEEQQPRVILRRDPPVTSPSLPSAHHSMGQSFNSNFLASPPPPRFSSPSASASFGTSSGPTLTGASNAFVPRSAGTMNMTMFGYGVPSSSSQPSSTFSPFGPSSSPPPHTTIPDLSDEHPSHSQHFVHRTLSPPTHGLEAARAS